MGASHYAILPDLLKDFWQGGIVKITSEISDLIPACDTIVLSSILSWLIMWFTYPVYSFHFQWYVNAYVSRVLLNYWLHIPGNGYDQ